MSAIILDLLGAAGYVALCIGLWWIYPPATLIVGGVLLLVAAIVGAQRGNTQ